MMTVKTIAARCARLGILAGLAGLPCALALAQDMPPVSSLPGGHRGPTGPVTLPLAETPDQGTAPPASPAAPPPAAPPARPASPDEPGLTLRGVRVEGGEELPRDGLEAIYRPLIGRWTSLADLEELRYRLTKYYVDRGYINSGAIFKPGQDGRDGIIVFQIVTGHLDEIRLSGQGRLRPAYLEGRLRPDAREPFNQTVLQDRFRLLLEDPLIERLDGRLLPGATPGSAVLDLTVERTRPWDAFARVDNYRPPSTGAERAYVGGTLRNLTGFGDILDLTLGHGFQGEGREATLGYTIPLTAADTRLLLNYQYNDSSLLEEPLAELDIDSETQRLDLGIAHPFWRTLEQQFRAGALFNWSRNETTLLGEPFSFSAGAVDGAMEVNALRLFQEYSRRQARQAYALRSVFSYGVELLDATVQDDGRPDSRFFAWLGQAQYVRQIDERGSQVILRAGAQLADQALLPLEQFTIGGVNTVRGYRENTLVADSGYAASLEVRYPVWDGKWPADLRQQVQLAAFADVGGAWNHGASDERQTLSSIGVGVIWSLETRLRAELYFAHPFDDVPEPSEHNLQDDGIHFMVQANF